VGVYSAKQRKKYATVGKDEFPIGDKTHAEKALQFIDKSDLSSGEKATVRAKAARYGVGTATKKKKADRKMKHIHD
jgi:hypothetical protein